MRFGFFRPPRAPLAQTFSFQKSSLTPFFSPSSIISFFLYPSTGIRVRAQDRGLRRRGEIRGQEDGIKQQKNLCKDQTTMKKTIFDKKGLERGGFTVSFSFPSPLPLALGFALEKGNLRPNPPFLSIHGRERRMMTRAAETKLRSKGPGFFSSVFFSPLLQNSALVSKPDFLFFPFSLPLFSTRNGRSSKQLGGPLECLRCSCSTAVLPPGEEGAHLTEESWRR